VSAVSFCGKEIVWNSRKTAHGPQGKEDNMKTWLILLLASLLVVGGFSYPSRGGEKKEGEKQKASVWMKAKTEYSRNILAGLTEADFDKIAENAKALNVTSFLEVLFRAKHPGYKQQVLLFASANQELIRQAKAKNLYGATLAFNQLTVSCVQCHQIVRDVKK
jgi:hypothetical protein